MSWRAAPATKKAVCSELSNKKPKNRITLTMDDLTKASWWLSGSTFPFVGYSVGYFLFGFPAFARQLIPNLFSTDIDFPVVIISSLARHSVGRSISWTKILTSERWLQKGPNHNGTSIIWFRTLFSSTFTHDKKKEARKKCKRSIVLCYEPSAMSKRQTISPKHRINRHPQRCRKEEKIYLANLIPMILLPNIFLSVWYHCLAGT